MTILHNFIEMGGEKERGRWRDGEREMYRTPSGNRHLTLFMFFPTWSTMIFMKDDFPYSLTLLRALYKILLSYNQDTTHNRPVR